MLQLCQYCLPSFHLSFFAPVTMPTQGQQFDVPGTAVVSGWGTLTSGGVSPNVLNFVEVPLVSDLGRNYLDQNIVSDY